MRIRFMQILLRKGMEKDRFGNLVLEKQQEIFNVNGKAGKITIAEVENWLSQRIGSGSHTWQNLCA